mmetsp:Transcript_135328/g.234645  ORF Transcript_135328/g.234645 Transcript_135328/m.234645 type:complete len:245 (-) Transcript_135328:3211-3945(-)
MAVGSSQASQGLKAPSMAVLRRLRAASICPFSCQARCTFRAASMSLHWDSIFCCSMRAPSWSHFAYKLVTSSVLMPMTSFMACTWPCRLAAAGPPASSRARTAVSWSPRASACSTSASARRSSWTMDVASSEAEPYEAEELIGRLAGRPPNCRTNSAQARPRRPRSSSTSSRTWHSRCAVCWCSCRWSSSWAWVACSCCVRVTTLPSVASWASWRLVRVLVCCRRASAAAWYCCSQSSSCRALS